tara:strand:- start:18394 stop:24870 length:6477 start_codon:yes stop_codon:yes gene_type:complete
MLNFNLINNCQENIEFLSSKNYISDDKLNLNIFDSENYYRDVGYYYEKHIFENLVNYGFKLPNNIFKPIIYNNNLFINKFIYLTKHYVENPNNDYYLKIVSIASEMDLVNKNVCDINVSYFIINEYNKYFFALETIRNIYFYISTDNFNNNIFKIPITYILDENNNTIIKNTHFYNEIEFTYTRVNDNYINLDILNKDKFNKNILEFLKPLLTYHCYLINKDNNFKSVLPYSDDIKNYARNISKLYDLRRFTSIYNIINSFDKYNNDNYFVQKFKNNYFSIIAKKYEENYTLSSVNLNIPEDYIYTTTQNNIPIDIVLPNTEPSYYTNSTYEITEKPVLEIQETKDDDKEEDDVDYEDIDDEITSEPVNEKYWWEYLFTNIFMKNIGIIIISVIIILTFSTIISHYNNSNGRSDNNYYANIFILFGIMITVLILFGYNIYNYHKNVNKIDEIVEEFNNFNRGELSIIDSLLKTPDSKDFLKNINYFNTKDLDLEYFKILFNSISKSNIDTSTINPEGTLEFRLKNTDDYRTTSLISHQIETLSLTDVIYKTALEKLKELLKDLNNKEVYETQERNVLIEAERRLAESYHQNEVIKLDIENKKKDYDTAKKDADKLVKMSEDVDKKYKKENKNLKELKEEFETIKKSSDTLSTFAISTQDSLQKMLTLINNRNVEGFTNYQNPTAIDLNDIDYDSFDFDTFLQDLKEQLAKDHYDDFDMSAFTSIFTTNADGGFENISLDTALSRFLQKRLIDSKEYIHISKQEIDRLIESLGLSDILQSGSDLYNTVVDAADISESIIKDVNLNVASIEVSELLNKVKDSQNLASLLRIFAAIELAKKDKYTSAIKYQEQLTESAFKESTFYRKLALDAVDRLSLHRELLNEKKKNKETEETNTETIINDIRTIKENLSRKEKETIDAKELAKETLESIKKMEKHIIDNDIYNNENMLKKEVIELLNFSIYTNKDVDTIIKSKYENLRKQYESESEIERIMEIIRQHKQNYIIKFRQQLEELNKIKEINIRLNDYTTKVYTYDAIIISEKQKHKIDKESRAVKIKELESGLIVNIDAEKRILDKIINLQNNLKYLIKEKTTDETELLNIENIKKSLKDSLNYDESYIQIIENEEKNNLDKINLLLSKIEQSLSRLYIEYENVKDKRHNDNFDRIDLVHIQYKKELEYVETIRNLELERDKASLNENYERKELVKSKLELSKINNDILNKRIEVLWLYNKITILKEKDLEYTNSSLNITYKFIEDVNVESIDINNNYKKNTEIINFNQIDLNKIAEMKTNEIAIKNNLIQKYGDNEVYVQQLQNEISELKKKKDTERILENQISIARDELEKILNKKIIFELALIKGHIDYNIIKIIKLTKEIINLFIEIDSLNYKKYIEKLIINQDKIKLQVIYNEKYRLIKMKEQMETELKYKLITLKKYDNIKEDDQYKDDLQKLKENTIKDKDDLINDIKLIDENIKKIYKYETDYKNKIEKAEKDYLKKIESYEYNIMLKKDTNTKNIRNLGKIMILFNKLNDEYIESREKLAEYDITMPKIALTPIIIPNKIRQNIELILSDNPMKYEINDDEFSNQIDNLLLTLLDGNDSEFINSGVDIKFIVILDLDYDTNYGNKDQFQQETFKTNLTKELSEAIEISKTIFDILEVSKGSIKVIYKINANNILDSDINPITLVENLISQSNDPNSKLRQGTYGNKITMIEIIRDDVLTKIDSPSYNIALPSYLTSTDSFDDIRFIYYNDRTTNYHNLLLHFPFITSVNVGDTTMTDYSKHNRYIYSAISGRGVNKIYKDYIELNNTLLKVDNINIMDMQKYSISFVIKLNNTTKDQFILLSNGTVSQKIHQDDELLTMLDTPLQYHNENIFTIGFMNKPKQLYIKKACKNNKYYGINTSDKLKINDGEWVHFIITNNDNKITVYKNLEKVVSFNTVSSPNNDKVCYTNNRIFEKKNLYIGGIKIDLDRYTKEINNLVGYSGGLKDLRIYNKELSHIDIKNIFLTNDDITQEPLETPPMIPIQYPTPIGTQTSYLLQEDTVSESVSPYTYQQLLNDEQSEDSSYIPPANTGSSTSGSANTGSGPDSSSQETCDNTHRHYFTHTHSTTNPKTTISALNMHLDNTSMSTGYEENMQPISDDDLYKKFGSLNTFTMNNLNSLFS